ncbi:hypothetical protein CK203_085772 [Vitis vinifera]|uniref:C2H2-type domain-containing protein n=1 Tax=Vitis vinifera TaxID=29760 RepID=A0A438E3B6_VITVI|nr:hypothetical protein CK203_085772 [Vitis vinifera]
MEDGRGWCCGVSAEVKQRQKGRAWWDGVFQYCNASTWYSWSRSQYTDHTHWDPYNPTNPDRPMFGLRACRYGNSEGLFWWVGSYLRFWIRVCFWVPLFLRHLGLFGFELSLIESIYGGGRSEDEACVQALQQEVPFWEVLGGHMRSHMIGNSAEAAERKKISSLNGGRSSKKESGFEGGGHSAYGLRENPKKHGGWLIQGVVHSKRMFVKNVERLSSNLEDHSWTNASQKPVMDRRKRSKRTNFNRTLAVYPSPSVSDTEQEQQELAICLMMLSRDSGHWVGRNMNCVSDGDEIVETKKLGDGKSKSAVLDSEAGPFENSDSGNVESLELKLEDGSGFDVFGAESGKGLKRLKCMKAGLGKDLKRPKCVKTELGKEENVRKRSKYQCLTCNKTFHSHQALGGHRANHKRVEGCNSSNYESIENSIETDTCPGPTPHKKLARFGSGKTPIAQDLSGKAEKKIGVCEDENSRTLVIKQEPLEIPGLIDLNLPAPIEEEANEHIQECLPEVTSPSADPTARSSFACPWKLFFVSIFCSGISSSFDVFHPET